MQVRVLGPVEVVATDGSPAEVGGRRPRTLLAALSLRAGEPMAASRLAEDVWGDALPAHPTRTVQTYLSRLRSVLGPDRIARSGHGYLLRLHDGELDLDRFDRLVARGRRELAASRPVAARRHLAEGLALWRGDPLEDLVDGPLVAAARARLEEARLAALEDRLTADLDTGRHLEVLPELRELVGHHPLRESLRGRLMLALYRAGRPAEALEAFACARATLAEALGADPSPGLVGLHAAILRGDVPEDRGGTPRRHLRPSAPRRLPVASLTSFVGRTRELRTVSELLGRARLVTVCGAGGTGKTRLATEAARAWRDRTGHDVAFADLTDADRGEVPQALADAVGSHVDRADDVPAVLEEDLAARDLLLLLDNCEHVVEEAGAIAGRLLEQCPGLVVLATSREALGRRGEHLLALRPLSLPPRGVPDDRERSAADAVQLFLDRARAADADFSPGAGTLAAVERICRLLGGIPLAIELAAARTRLLSCELIAERLERSHDVLATDQRRDAHRHRSLDAALQWSYDLLDDDEQALLRRLSVTSGGFPISAAEHLHEASGGGRTPLAVLDSLVARSMVETTRAGGPPRLHLLEPVRRFARTRLTEVGGLADGRRDHALWVLAVTEQADGDGDAAFATGEDAVLAREVGNLRVALRWSVEAREPTIAQRLVAAASSFWWANGHLREGLRRGWEALALPGTTAPTVRAACLAGIALLENHDGRWSAGHEHAEEAVHHFTSSASSGSPRHRARALVALAHALLHDDEVDRAAALVQDGARSATESGDRFARLGATVVTAWVAAARGDHRAAVGILDDMAAAAKASADAVSEIVARFNLGLLALQAGAPDRAADHVEAVLARERASGIDPFGHDHTHGAELLLLARARAMQDRSAEARALTRQALAAAQRGGDRQVVDAATVLLDELSPG